MGEVPSVVRRISSPGLHGGLNSSSQSSHLLTERLGAPSSPSFSCGGAASCCALLLQLNLSLRPFLHPFKPLFPWSHLTLSVCCSFWDSITILLEQSQAFSAGSLKPLRQAVTTFLRLQSTPELSGRPEDGWLSLLPRGGASLSLGSSSLCRPQV